MAANDNKVPFKRSLARAWHILWAVKALCKAIDKLDKAGQPALSRELRDVLARIPIDEYQINRRK